MTAYMLALHSVRTSWTFYFVSALIVSGISRNREGFFDGNCYRRGQGCSTLFLGGRHKHPTAKTNHSSIHSSSVWGFIQPIPSKGYSLQHHIGRYRENDPAFMNMFSHSIYVDDLTLGGTTEEEALVVITKAREQLAAAGFNLRTFVSNSVAFHH